MEVDELSLGEMDRWTERIDRQDRARRSANRQQRPQRPRASRTKTEQPKTSGTLVLKRARRLRPLSRNRLNRMSPPSTPTNTFMSSRYLLFAKLVMRADAHDRRSRAEPHVSLLLSPCWPLVASAIAVSSPRLNSISAVPVSRLSPLVPAPFSSFRLLIAVCPVFLPGRRATIVPWPDRLTPATTTLWPTSK